jgi:D-sedoheptulose 7-phosphate isomerase
MESLKLYFEGVTKTSTSIDLDKVEACVDSLFQLRQKSGRVFVLGMGGSAANASHMVNDLRKICKIEAYAPTDNVAEFSASCNDEGLGSYFPRWLVTSNLNSNDAIFVLSVGGGSKDLNVSMELVNAIEVAKLKKAKILGIVGRDGGETLKNSKDVILVPTFTPNLETPLVESFQVVIWHGIVFHPRLKQQPSKWESVVDSI